MLNIPNDTYNRLRETLLGCGPFTNDQQLRAIFANTSLAPWRNRIPEASNPVDRVEAVVQFLIEKRHSGLQENALVLFLGVLRDRVDPYDDCYERLTKMANELRGLFQGAIGATHSDKMPAQANVPSHSARNLTYICYSHKDKEYLQELQVHLAYYIRKDNITVWDDTTIVPGSKWQEEIEKALKSAKVAVLFISADFLASDFIVDYELPYLIAAAKQKSITILPVIVRHSAFKYTELAQFSPVNEPSEPIASMTRAKRDIVWSQVAELVRNAIKV